MKKKTQKVQKNEQKQSRRHCTTDDGLKMEGSNVRSLPPACRMILIPLNNDDVAVVRLG